MASRYSPGALQDYLDGKTFAEIAKKYKVKLDTVNTWSFKYEWWQRRKEAERKAEDTIFHKFQKKIEQNSELLLEGVRISAAAAVQAVKILYENKDYDRDRAKFHQWAKTMSLLATVQKGTIPTASDELSERILSELEKLNADRRNSDK